MTSLGSALSVVVLAVVWVEGMRRHLARTSFRPSRTGPFLGFLLVLAWCWVPLAIAMSTAHLWTQWLAVTVVSVTALLWLWVAFNTAFQMYEDPRWRRQELLRLAREAMRDEHGADGVDGGLQ